MTFTEWLDMFFRLTISDGLFEPLYAKPLGVLRTTPASPIASMTSEISPKYMESLAVRGISAEAHMRCPMRMYGFCRSTIASSLFAVKNDSGCFM